jgi:hypothetical protein
MSRRCPEISRSLLQKQQAKQRLCSVVQAKQRLCSVVQAKQRLVCSHAAAERS